ncbi:hypothetical protein QRD02_14075 [Aequorivita sp. SDUM287046]|uniref:SMODS-associating 2TM beta-strand rich effector domain-containing protein n=1 Tax=Aequorivita aurantiaca TaxID=3053356 RepID=A0ABT8DQJ9_9FLAO|nr:hypothetical protein [Aequorivita aurantiaca]
MSKRLKIVIGIFSIVIGLTLKSLFNHNLKYWELIKYSSLFLFVIGLSILLFPLWEEWKYKPKKKFKEQPTKWLVYYSKSVFALGFTLFTIIGLEKSGKYLNYTLRNYYLSSNSKITNGTIINYVRINLVKAGQEDFYLIQFNDGEKLIERGLLIDYSDWDNDKGSEDFKMTQNGIVVNKVKGGKVNIQFSERFPSFLKIVE